MIKEKYENITVKKKIWTRYCDICKKKITYSSHCEICGKDLCNKCIEHEEYSGDNRIVYCKNCWTIGQEFRVKIKELEEKIYSLTDKWYDKANQI